MTGKRFSDSGRVAALASCALFLAAVGSRLWAQAPAGTEVGLIEVTGSINPGSADFIKTSIERAAAQKLPLLVVKLDTPGGLLTSTHDLVKLLLNTPIPVAVFVTPAGARAGSAGVFITLAANVAAMSPGTRIGAAHPVMAGGEDTEKGGGKDMAKKIENDTATFIESIAKVRARNAEWAIKAVKESVSITSDDALKEKVIDVVAADLEDLLKQIDGREVEVAGGKVVLNTAGAKARLIEMTIRQRLVNTFSDPNIAYILMMLGILGIVMELYHPGVVFPGVLGGICLLLALISFQVLPINYGGFLLILLAAGLFIAEIYVQSFGILGMGGAVALLLGSIMLIDGGGGTNPEFYFDADFGVSMKTIIPMFVFVVGLLLFVGFFVLKVRLRRAVTGAEGMIGETGACTTDVTPAGGKILVRGEYWNAVSERTIKVGEKVTVTGITGLKLKVVPAAGGGEPEGKE